MLDALKSTKERISVSMISIVNTSQSAPLVGPTFIDLALHLKHLSPNERLRRLRGGSDCSLGSSDTSRLFSNKKAILCMMSSIKCQCALMRVVDCGDML